MSVSVLEACDPRKGLGVVLITFPNAQHLLGRKDGWTDGWVGGWEEEGREREKEGEMGNGRRVNLG